VWITGSIPGGLVLRGATTADQVATSHWSNQRRTGAARPAPRRVRERRDPRTRAVRYAGGDRITAPSTVARGLRALTWLWAVR